MGRYTADELDRRLDKEGRWQIVESPEPEKRILDNEEKHEIKVEPEKVQIEILKAKVPLLVRAKITVDFASWKALDKAGLCHKYLDMHKRRVAIGDCQTCDKILDSKDEELCKKLSMNINRRTQSGGHLYCGGGVRYYECGSDVVIKCLNCGTESRHKKFDNWSSL